MKRHHHGEIIPESPRLPISVCSHHTAEWYRVRNAFLAGAVLSSAIWAGAFWIIQAL